MLGGLKKKQPSSQIHIHYDNAKEINFLKDLKEKFLVKNDSTLKFNSDRDPTNSIAQKLYKKIVRQGFIKNPKEFAIFQTQKKVDTMYDTSDKWIDDSEVITEPQSQINFQFSKFKAVSNIDINEFYKANNLLKVKTTVQKQKPSILDEILKDPLNVIKFNELKKKIKTTIVAGEKSLFLNDKR